MPTVKIRSQLVDVDIREELEHFNWTRPRWTGDKLIAESPFRYDSTPSFYVYLNGDNAGYWGDSGFYDDEWARGGFIKLLSFLRNESREETEDYLISEYGRLYDDSGKIKLRVPELLPKSAPPYLPHNFLEKYEDNFSYLSSRGISADVQQQARIKYDRKSNAIIIPWYDLNGRLCNVKYRQTRGKVFWYQRGAVPIRSLIYGIERVREPVAVLEEAEIDALSWAEVGVQGIAVGGANFTDEQADVIKRSLITTLYISGDNDKAGGKFMEQVEDKLRGYVELRKITKPEGVKDTNEALVRGHDIREMLNSARCVTIVTRKYLK